MAKGKKQDIGDIIRGAIDAMGKPKRRVAGKSQRKGAVPISPEDAPKFRGKLIGPGQKFRISPPNPAGPRRLTPAGPKPEGPRRRPTPNPAGPRRAGDKPFDREESILPRRPKPNNPTPPSRRKMPKRKPTAGPTKRKGNY